MKRSSARQLELDYSAQDPSPIFADGDTDRVPDVVESASSGTGFPEFENTRGAYAVASKIAGRINAASATPDEVDALLRERKALLDKKLDGAITRSEANRLQYVRWSLDRIEDARYGAGLDTLEDLVSRYERVLVDMDALKGRLDHLQKGRR